MPRKEESIGQWLVRELLRLAIGIVFTGVAAAIFYFVVWPWTVNRLVDTMKKQAPSPVQTKR